MTITLENETTTAAGFRVRNKRDAGKSKLNMKNLFDAVEWAIAEFNHDQDATQYDQQAGLWDQGYWGKGELTKRTLKDDRDERYVQVKCSSGMCIAGNIVAQAGDRFVINEDEADYFRNDPEPVEVDYVLPKGSKELVEIEQRAKDLLGNVNLESRTVGGYWGFRTLFDGENTIEDVVTIASEIAHREGYAVTFTPRKH